MRARVDDESRESASLLKLALSFVAAAVVLAVLTFVVSGALSKQTKRRAQVGSSSSSTNAATVNFVLPPLPSPDVTTYYLVATEAEAEAVRVKADEDLIARRRAGLLQSQRVVAVVADPVKSERDYQADLMRGAPPLMQNGFGVRYEVVDLRR